MPSSSRNCSPGRCFDACWLSGLREDGRGLTSRAVVSTVGCCSRTLFVSPSRKVVLGTVAAWSIHLGVRTNLNDTAGFREITSAWPYDGLISVTYRAASTACK